MMTDMQQVQQVERYFKTIDLMTVDKFPVYTFNGDQHYDGTHLDVIKG